MSIKKKTIIISLIIIVTILSLITGYIFYNWSKGKPCIPEIPDRIGKIPETAKWIGGCDGGYWFDIVEINTIENICRIKIFYDYNGELISDKYYKLQAECKTKFNNESELINAILGYDFETIHTKNPKCELIPVHQKDVNK